MNGTFQRFATNCLLLPALFVACLFGNATAQQPVSNRLQDLRSHGIEQYQQGHYDLAAQSLSEYLNRQVVSPGNTELGKTGDRRKEAEYFLVLSNVKRGTQNSRKQALDFIEQNANPVYQQRVAFALAQQHFQRNELQEAIVFYELAGIHNLSNDEIADAKFELAYCYFNDQRFSQALPLFAAIKELPSNKYYVPGNYYYGLLAYNNKDYKAALKSFDRIVQEEAYKDIVPYYQAEIHYFMGEPEKVLKISNSYLRKKGDLYYRKEMHLLTAQTLFEQNRFKEALPHFEYFYDHSEKIRKEELYEIAYTYYRLEDWQKAIERFQPLSNAKDSLGQTSMYLLGDCYLKINDRKGARNAFTICSDMRFNPSQKEAATFLSAKLSYELGDDGLAGRRLYGFIKEFPESVHVKEATTLLSTLLLQNSNYDEAFAILSDMAVKDNETWAIYQRVTVGHALQLLMNNDLKKADSVFNLSLQQPISEDLEAIAYFWKGEIAYKEKRYEQAVQYSSTFIRKAANREEPLRKINRNATVQNAYLNIGYAHLESQKYSEAERAFAAARENKVKGYSGELAADASLREADALFMQQDYARALKSYDGALNAGVANGDYALFQKAMVLAQLDQAQESKDILSRLVQKTPASPYQNDAKYELALRHIEENRNQQAIDLLRSLVDKPGASENLRAKSLLSLAYAYRQDRQTELAIQGYKEYIDLYPTAAEREDALEALRSLYVAENAPEQYVDFLSSRDLPRMDEASIENAFYDAATQEYSEKKWAAAVAGFTKYLDRFPKGSYAAKAHFYRGEALFQLKEYEQALADYEAVQAEGWNEYSEDASKKSAELAFQSKDYDQAALHFANLRNVAMDEEGLQVAYLGLMKSNFEQEKYEDARAYADTLLSLPKLTSKASLEAKLYKARLLQMDGDYPEALDLFKEVDQGNQGLLSAEARYRIAEIYLSQKKYQAAEENAVRSSQSSGGSEYWVVRSYILLADIMTAQKEYFDAKATLQSVIKNAESKELRAIANEKLQQVLKLEKAGSKLSE